MNSFTPTPGGLDCAGCMYFARERCDRCGRRYCYECAVEHRCSDPTVEATGAHILSLLTDGR